AAVPAQQTLEAGGLLDEILEKGGVREAQQKENLTKAFKDWMSKVLEESDNIVDADAQKLLDDWIANIDQVVSAQLNEVMHDPKFQKLEASWRGLKYLVDNTITGPDLRIKVLNVGREELASDFEAAGAIERSHMYHKIVESEYGQAGGKPYGILIGDYEFGWKPEDLYLLREVGKIAAMAHAPFVGGVSPRMLDLDRFEEMKGPNTYADVFATGKQYIEWRDFRDSPDSRYVALTMPRVLSRLPYGKDTKKVAEFDYEEAVDGRDHTKYLWMNAAWAYAARITDAFAKTGWLADTRGFEGGGKVEGLPVHLYRTDSGDLAQKCPTEIQIPDWRELELSNLGFLPLIHWKDTSYAVFMGAQTSQKPKEYFGPDGVQATENAALSAKLNYILCVSRFAHFLKVLARRMIGRAISRERLEEILNEFIKTAVVEDPYKLPESERAKYPLKEARVEVQPVKGRPGWYEMKAWLLPHLHLEGLTAAMHLVSQLPAKKG
ncbi:MAG TPA: type VI secretion system contractile sheath large subunit, partial [Gemmataceae bacterium]|nr:type VI secretion system contractile sheath large subunit [Gemmataceae bacterium]